MYRKTTLEKMLAKKAKEAKKLKAKEEAKNIHNYNLWKKEHDKMVKKELKKLERKDKFPLIFKILLIIIAILGIYVELVKWFPDIPNIILR